jgi:hypothetical protein
MKRCYLWTREEEERLQQLFMQHALPGEIAKELGRDRILGKIESSRSRPDYRAVRWPQIARAFEEPSRWG